MSMILHTSTIVFLTARERSKSASNIKKKLKYNITIYYTYDFQEFNICLMLFLE